MSWFCEEGFEGLEEPLRAALSERPSWHGMELVVPRGKSRVALLENGRGLFYIKRYQDPFIRRLMGNPFRPSRADREFHALEHLRRVHGNAIETVAWGERRRCGTRWISVLITRAWPGSMNLGSLRRLAAKGEASPDVLERLQGDLGFLAERLGAIHAGGCVLRDNLDKNILYRPDVRGPEAFAWIDQPHLRRRQGPLPLASRFDDLAAILRGLTRLFPQTGGRSRPVLAFLEAYQQTLPVKDRAHFLGDPRLRPRTKSPLRVWLGRRRKRLWFALTKSAPIGNEKDALDARSRQIQDNLAAALSASPRTDKGVL